MPNASNASTTHGASHPLNSIEDVIAELEALRRLMLDAAARAGRLVSTLRQQRRQSRAIQTAVEAIRGLKIDA